MAKRRDKVGEVFNLAGGGAKAAGWRGAKGARLTRVRPPPRCARPREVGNLAYLARGLPGPRPPGPSASGPSASRRTVRLFVRDGISLALEMSDYAESHVGLPDLGDVLGIHTQFEIRL